MSRGSKRESLCSGLPTPESSRKSSSSRVFFLFQTDHQLVTFVSMQIFWLQTCRLGTCALFNSQPSVISHLYKCEHTYKKLGVGADGHAEHVRRVALVLRLGALPASVHGVHLPPRLQVPCDGQCGQCTQEVNGPFDGKNPQ